MTKRDPHLLLKANLKQLRLPTMLAEHEKLAREAAESNQDFLDYLLRLTELELATRASNALQSRIEALEKRIAALEGGAKPKTTRRKSTGTG